MKAFKGPNKQRGFFGIGALVLGGIGMYQSYSAQQSAKEATQQQTAALQQQTAAQKEAAGIQQRAANVQSQQERIKQLREARVARARVLSSALNMGVGVASTGVSGATSSISSQYGANVGSINVAQTFAEGTAAAQQRAADFGSQAATYGARASAKMAEASQWQQLSQMGFQAAGQMGAWDKLFGPAVQPAQAARTVSSSEFMSEPSIFKMGR